MLGGLSIVSMGLPNVLNGYGLPISGWCPLNTKQLVASGETYVLELGRIFSFLFRKFSYL